MPILILAGHMPWLSSYRALEMLQVILRPHLLQVEVCQEGLCVENKKMFPAQSF